MQLHVCLLLFLITTDEILAWQDQRCGGNVSLDRQPSGHFSLSLPGPFNDASTLNPKNQQPGRTSQNCTWVLDIPMGRMVLLKLDWSEGGTRISVGCVGSEEHRVLRSRDTVLLSGCDGNKATLSWTGAGRSSHSLQLGYFVQEDERNSSEDRLQTGTIVTNIATVAQEGVKDTEESRSHVRRDLVGGFSPWFVSSASSQDEGPLRPTSPQQGLPVSWRADRETLPLPEEKPNNGADTSGASHLTSEPTSARTFLYFQHAGSTDTKSQTENPTLTRTEMSWTDSTIAPLGTDIHKSASTETSTHTDQSVSNSRVFTISPSEMPTLERNTIPYPLDGAIRPTPNNQQALPWTSVQSTDRFTSDLTSNPLNSSTQPPQRDSSSANTDNRPTRSSSSPSPSGTQSPNAHLAELDTAVGTVEAASGHPHTSRFDSSTSDAPTQTAAAASESFDEKFGNTDVVHSLAPSTQSQTDAPESTESSSYTPSPWRRALTEDMQNNIMTNTISSSPDKDAEQASGFTGSFSTPRAAQMTEIKNSGSTAATNEAYTPPFPETVPRDSSPSDFAHLSSSTAAGLPVHTNTLQTHFPHDSPTALTSSVTESSPSVSSQTSHLSYIYHLPSFTNIPAYKQSHNFITATDPPLLSTIKSGYREVKGKKRGQFWQRSPTSGPALRPSQQNSFVFTQSALTSTPTWSSTRSPMFYVVPNQPAKIRVGSVELLLQIVVEDSRSASAPGLEEDTAAWVQPYLQRAPGFSKLLDVWSSGNAVQSLVVFKTSSALQWLGVSGPNEHMSLLERTGLAQAVHEGRMFRSSKITNITLGGLQGDVCDWLLQCPAGYKCTPEPGATNYSCSSVCRFHYCHHHGFCTHHPGQLPVCRCLVGEDFWYMGQRCDMKMTRLRLVGACVTILVIVTTVIGTLAFVAVRHYRAILIQTKVDQTRSSYRRFNHFDELSGRFWLRSWAGSADSLDNPAFTRSDELMHLRALDRPCCYHDDTLSLGSTCPSHGAHISTIYPNSSQYGWRGSGMSLGDGVLDSGKASDLSVCSWPVEPIHWTPFPLLQHLASHRTPAVRVTRPRSYCEGMELVDLGKSWTA
ncbi:uncharacterized protein si:ch211-14k19.8 [Kryptolebias marmoratus]|uniref:Uncharacterized LOC108241341 n=1 Tax=Kryptolebias marmoratus TaxID=37003 RepID=A0A3Q3AJS8_KRYMA|nr:uncharacterized protein si:ch211-14k19.8 [Kryptolebias marmoratus]